MVGFEVVVVGFEVVLLLFFFQELLESGHAVGLQLALLLLAAQREH